MMRSRLNIGDQLIKHIYLCHDCGKEAKTLLHGRCFKCLRIFQKRTGRFEGRENRMREAANAYELRGRALAAGKAIPHPSHKGG